MHLDVSQDFLVGLDRLWTALGRADYVDRKYRSLGSTSLRLRTFVSDAESIEVELDREATVAMDELPVWARLLTARRQAMHQRSRWTRVGRDRVDVALDIRAVRLGVVARGTGSVRELSPTHSRMTLHFDVVTTSPAVPPIVTELFARQVARALEADHAFTVAFLQGGAPGPQEA